MTRSLHYSTIVVACAAATGITLYAGQDTDERRLWDTEFLQKRPPARTPAPARKAPTYRRTTPKPAAADEKAPGEMLGVTIWKLRKPTASDNADARLLLLEEAGTATDEWTPERVESQSAFASGDRVRLSIESPRNGYLYVFDREQYADGSTSEPYLIFPTQRVRGGDNAVGGGKIVELPDKRAFVLKPMRSDYRGELLTVIVADAPLSQVTVGPTLQKFDAAVVEQWERDWGAAAERFEMAGGAGKTYTKEEKEAAAAGQVLTQADELPQTLFRVAARPGSPLLVAVPLKIAP
jgi:hypothetical protein